MSKRKLLPLLRSAAFATLVTGTSVTPSLVQDAPPQKYDRTWYISKFWSGEYPAGFSVIKKGVVVLGRSGMDRTLPQKIKCELPYLAVIHPWNGSRWKKSKIEFLAASKIVPLTVKEDFLFESEPKVRIPIRKGDVIEYLQYGAEGSFSVRINGKIYYASQDLFDHVEDVSKDRFIEDEWFAINSLQGGRAYIFLPDIVDLPPEKLKTLGISLDRGEATDYGKAQDLTEQRAREIRGSKD